ncbi:hypothetical protein D3C80_2063600 [compost metagenome]
MGIVEVAFPVLLDLGIEAVTDPQGRFDVEIAEVLRRRGHRKAICRLPASRWVCNRRLQAEGRFPLYHEVGGMVTKVDR